MRGDRDEEKSVGKGAEGKHSNGKNIALSHHI